MALHPLSVIRVLAIAAVQQSGALPGQLAVAGDFEGQPNDTSASH